jgi:hypothetical protein
MTGFGDKLIFLRALEQAIAEHPDWAGGVSDAVTAGLVRALDNHVSRAADFECALAMQVHKMKGRDKKLAEVLEKWKGKTSLNWG